MIHKSSPSLNVLKKKYRRKSFNEIKKEFFFFGSNFSITIQKAFVITSNLEMLLGMDAFEVEWLLNFAHST